MGFIRDNINTFEVYLTDLGKQKFFDGGFKDAITYFSVSDADNDYSAFDPAKNEAIEFVVNPICINYLMITSSYPLDVPGVPEAGQAILNNNSNWSLATNVLVNPIDNDGVDMSEFWENLPIGSVITIKNDYTFLTNSNPTPSSGGNYSISLTFTGTTPSPPAPLLPAVYEWCVDNNEFTGITRNYQIGEAAEYNGEYYIKVRQSDSHCGCEFLPINDVAWNKAILFDSTLLTKQPISTINHAGTYRTSLANGDPSSDDMVEDVFTQIALRGNSVDNTVYRRALFGTKHNIPRSYVMYEPDEVVDGTTILSYIKIDE